MLEEDDKICKSTNPQMHFSWVNMAEKWGVKGKLGLYIIAVALKMQLFNQSQADDKFSTIVLAAQVSHILRAF